MLARTKLLTFILSFVIIFSILVTLFSSNGYMVNRDLRKYAENLDSDIERKRAEIDMLRAEGERTLLSENFLPLNGEKIIATFALDTDRSYARQLADVITLMIRMMFHMRDLDLCLCL